MYGKSDRQRLNEFIERENRPAAIIKERKQKIRRLADKLALKEFQKTFGDVDVKLCELTMEIGKVTDEIKHELKELMDTVNHSYEELKELWDLTKVKLD